jgi:hypothetical protein
MDPSGFQRPEWKPSGPSTGRSGGDAGFRGGAFVFLLPPPPDPPARLRAVGRVRSVGSRPSACRAVSGVERSERGRRAGADRAGPAPENRAALPSPFPSDNGKFSERISDLRRVMGEIYAKVNGNARRGDLTIAKKGAQ